MDNPHIAVIALFTCAFGLTACTAPGASNSSDPATSQSADDLATAPTESTDGSPATDVSPEADASSSPSDGATTASQDQMALPTDPYFEYDWLLFNAGQAKALNECLATQGVELGLPEVAYDAASSADGKGFEQRHYLLTVDRAKERGYRRLRPPAAFQAYDTKIIEVVPTLSFTQIQAFSTCGTSIMTDKTFLYPYDAEDFASFATTPAPLVDPAWAAFQPQLSRADEQGPWKAGQDWRTCMADSPISVAANQPNELPNSEMKEAWYNTADKVQVLGGDPPQAEIDFATKDAQCRESSGYNQRVTELYTQFLEQDMTQHPEKYKKIKQKIAEKTAQVKAYLGI